MLLDSLLHSESNHHLDLKADKPDEFDHKLYTSEIIVKNEFIVLEKPYFGFDSDCLTLFIKSVPRDCPREDLLDEFSRLEGKAEIIQVLLPYRFQSH